ncbi:uncharacterized protein LOC130980565 [Arachis stenosperma]|uniref:uncharacterized protein LOC130980565 n=1 Tax=Arachis stenosperma TaxID=217475 RepID=UPI0025AD17E1|nr:uncharacterized protein LOC130980565 [Arachis stenosperma]
MSVTVYFKKLKTIWEDLDSFKAIPSCECGRNCSCGLGVIRDFRTEDQQERQFQSFDFVSEPKLIAQTITQPATLLNTAEAFQGRGRGRGREGKNPGFERGQGGRGKMQCSHYGKIGHFVDTCYKKHGLPPHLKQRYNTAFTNISATEFDSEGSNENLRNPYSGQDGDVTSLDFTPEQKSALLALLSKEEQKPSHSADPHKEPLPTPHLGKLVHIMHFTSNILALNVSNKKFASWVTDTGATDHVSYSLNDFHTYHEIAPILVKLPNGALAISKIAETIIFTNELYLVDALYIPSFNFKLISVSKATSHLHCHMNFDDQKCKIQDTNSEKVIGVARACGGLYKLNKKAVRPNFAQTTSILTLPKSEIKGINI